MKRGDGLNLLMVLGNPATHSVAEKMFFSYEKTRNGKRFKEHRFWKALRDLGILKFDRNVEEPTAENNSYKRNCLLNGRYTSDFNLFLLPYFSFPTPATGRFNGVGGIRKMVGRDVFEEMKKFEFQRFENIISSNDINNVICFQKTNVLEEIKRHTRHERIKDILGKPVYKINVASKDVILYTTEPTRAILTDNGKQVLNGVLSDIKTRCC